MVSKTVASFHLRYRQCQNRFGIDIVAIAAAIFVPDYCENEQKGPFFEHSISNSFAAKPEVSLGEDDRNYMGCISGWVIF